MSTFILVHGAWHGGWAWRRVSVILEHNDHLVFTPTLTGLGERSHLISADITLDTMVDDIVNVMKYEDLNDITLVGHSFAGTVITGVADREAARIKQLIYLDASILEDGECIFDNMQTDIVKARKKLAKDTSDGLSLPVPRGEDLGIFDDDQWQSVKDFLTPHPLSTYTSTLNLTHPPGNNLPCHYIVCTRPYYTPLTWARERAEQYAWPIIEIETGHDAMITAPEELSDMLMQLNANA
jgi:pimeloyl-ACP methyl ester carboxylesterase